MNYFKKNIHFIRSKKELTLKEMSLKIGFTASQWNNYELGYSFPKFLDLIKISKYFGISESDLIHKDLERIEQTSLNEEKNQDEIILLQSKIIKMQEEKINDLEVKLTCLKKDQLQKTE
jgi:transcriptional regulator with XRE-family HTH domain